MRRPSAIQEGRPTPTVAGAGQCEAGKSIKDLPSESRSIVAKATSESHTSYLDCDYNMAGCTLIRLRVNGEQHVVAAPPHHTLLEVLREELRLTGTKHGCELGECGACTVLVDGQPVLSCLVLPLQVAGHDVETVEGLARGGQLHPLQKAFANFGAVQCGYCIPGILLAARHLLTSQPNPTDQDIREALSGNLCRCTGYHKIVEAVQMAARDLRVEAAKRHEPAAALH